MLSKLRNWPGHPYYAVTASTKGKAPAKPHETGGKAKLGTLPEWNLADLYQGPDSPKLKSDLETSERAADAMQERYAGKLAALLDGGKGGAPLAQAVREFEALNDILGRIVSYASLLYSADTSDPKRQKFFGDIQEKITAISSKLLFFPLELNRLDDAALETAMANSELGHYRPWLEDLRKEKPYQLEDKLEQLFHEKAVTARGAWDRLFNETMTSLRFEADGEKLSLEPTLNRLLDPDGDKRREAAEALAKVFKDNVRLFTLITNTLAKDKEISDRWRGFVDVADSRHLANRVEKEVVDALVAAVREAYPRISHRYYAMKARWLGKKTLEHWDRNAPLPGGAEAGDRLGRCAKDRARGLRRFLAAHGRHRRPVLRQRLDRCAGARGKIPRRLLAPDRAERASLYPAQLSGQAARRDDARA